MDAVEVVLSGTCNFTTFLNYPRTPLPPIGRNNVKMNCFRGSPGAAEGISSRRTASTLPLLSQSTERLTTEP
jgi:hypothetical protein